MAQALIFAGDTSMATSKRVGSKAAKLLSTSKSAAVKSVAGSALRQEHKKPKRKK